MNNLHNFSDPFQAFLATVCTWLIFRFRWMASENKKPAKPVNLRVFGLGYIRLDA